jgi:hypothetical protein
MRHDLDIDIYYWDVFGELCDHGKPPITARYGVGDNSFALPKMHASFAGMGFISCFFLGDSAWKMPILSGKNLSAIPPHRTHHGVAVCGGGGAVWNLAIAARIAAFHYGSGHHGGGRFRNLFDTR